VILFFSIRPDDADVLTSIPSGTSVLEPAKLCHIGDGISTYGIRPTCVENIYTHRTEATCIHRDIGNSVVGNINCSRSYVVVQFNTRVICSHIRDNILNSVTCNGYGVSTQHQYTLHIYSRSGRSVRSIAGHCCTRADSIVVMVSADETEVAPPIKATPLAQVLIWLLSTRRPLIVCPDADVLAVVEVRAAGSVVALVPPLPPQYIPHDVAKAPVADVLPETFPLRRRTVDDTVLYSVIICRRNARRCCDPDHRYISNSSCRSIGNCKISVDTRSTSVITIYRYVISAVQFYLTHVP
jgi:hypothetical protein